MFLFPEGTRATGTDLGQFKHGATLLALEHNIPIVPVYLGGVQDIRPKGSREVRKGRAYVEILPPVHFSKGSDVNAATETLWRRMNEVHLAHAASTVEASQRDAA